MEIKILVCHLVKQTVIQRMFFSEKNQGEKVDLYQSLCPCYRFLYGQVKEQYNEGLFHNFWVTNGTIWIKEYKYSKPMYVTHVSYL